MPEKTISYHSFSYLEAHLNYIGVSDAHLFFPPDSFMELIIRFVAMAVNGEPVGVLCVASSSSTDQV